MQSKVRARTGAQLLLESLPYIHTSERTGELIFRFWIYSVNSSVAQKPFAGQAEKGPPSCPVSLAQPTTVESAFCTANKATSLAASP